MSVWEVIAVYAVIPALIIGILAALTVGVGRHRANNRYEPGQEWDHPDRLWAGDAPVAALPVDEQIGAAKGGAHASW